MNFICTFRTYFNTNNLDMYLQYETDNLLYSSDIYDVLTPVCTYITWKILELNSDEEFTKNLQEQYSKFSDVDTSNLI